MTPTPPTARMSEPRGSSVVVRCLRCGDPFIARTADRKRGWALYCSKSCKAKAQEARTGQHRARHYRTEFGGNPQFDRRGEYIGFTMGPEDLAASDHGDHGDD